MNFIETFLLFIRIGKRIPLLIPLGRKSHHVKAELGWAQLMPILENDVDAGVMFAIFAYAIDGLEVEAFDIVAI